ncbi:MAG: DUF599 domain-containing protein [Candidatus Hydrothermarchaeaceae archaeon]
MDISKLDLFAVGIFLICTVGYHNIYYPYVLSRHPMKTAKGKINIYRTSWVENILESGNINTAVQQIRNLTMVATLFASSSLIILGVITNVYLTTYGPSLLIGKLDAFSIKIYLLMTLFGTSFLLFLFSLRHLNYFNVLIGAKREVVEEIEGTDMATMLANRMNLGMNRYTLGARCYYYSLGVIAWFLSTWACIAITVLITLMVITTRDFK